jgi:hypothetical protein
VLKRKGLLQVVRQLPQQENFPFSLIKQLETRIRTWLVPLYGYSEDEELGTVQPDALTGAPLFGEVLATVVCLHHFRCPPHFKHSTTQALLQLHADALNDAIGQGLLVDEGGFVKVTTTTPTRQLMLLAMEAHGIKLDRFDMVAPLAKGTPLVPVEQLWAAVSNAGGPEEVRLSTTWAACMSGPFSSMVSLLACCAPFRWLLP